jgi:hypothetical protein
MEARNRFIYGNLIQRPREIMDFLIKKACYNRLGFSRNISRNMREKLI